MCGFLVDTGSGFEQSFVEKEAHRLQHRGPDQARTVVLGTSRFFFFRLAVMDPSRQGDQPFLNEDGLCLVCNGEIYNEPALRARIPDHVFRSQSDCEVILPLFRKWGIRKLARTLDGEFAFVLFDRDADTWYAARDPLGIRPLFFGRSLQNGQLLFASEAKALFGLCERVEIFPPGHVYDGRCQRFLSYRDLAAGPGARREEPAEIRRHIRELLTDAVEKRLRSDVPIGFLLSGGLDSSLVCAIAARASREPIHTFAIGIEEEPIDTGYGRDVARHLGTRHHEILFSREDALAALSHVIYHLESWDITTVRASVGMYLVCKAIRGKSELGIKVLLTGEVSDELFGYKYTDFAPTAAAFQEEAAKRLRELHVYDVLRADRCISAFGLEARVPFGDVAFVEYVMSLDPELKLNRYGIGKYWLRQAFQDGGYLPDRILNREKAAFSDAVGHGLVDVLKCTAERMYTERELEAARDGYAHCPPQTKEALLYRDIFHSFFPRAAHLIPAFWMPNPTWPHCAVSDPSARVLPNYGASGYPHRSATRTECQDPRPAVLAVS